ncbi:GntR family transcriptional regulator (plasmid) [Streptomyces sp. BB1-1-1]|uniref:GntR family transcriptional regulator n=1 Tax=Streptomyces sp. BB1-1-1 TaxID=3074430 RepID=UPI002877FD6A|nr:GntR family transcriptional regulator [Streptomyces sp. BB1-1-1]WND40828.1 GntR family transcriptional regulator [Streptomyces sp. BB1-1-1]
MTLPLEDDPRPPYLQAAEVLRAKVYSGEYPAGSQLPSARVLQEGFGVSSSTVQNALRVLKREGLVYSVLGRGSYVSGTHPGLPPAAGTAPSRFPDAAVTAEHDPRPPYVRTADLLREEIRSGNFPSGRLPSARELQDRFGIANSTAQNAVRVLKREGLVYAVKGRGVFVRSTARQGEQPLLGEQALSARPDSRERPRTEEELAADLAAAEQRLARAADAYQAAGAQLDVLIREARRRGMPVPTAAHERDGASA